MQIADLLNRLTRLEPDSTAAKAVRRQAEQAMRQILKQDGIRGIRRLVKDLNARGRHLEPVRMWAGLHAWREQSGERLLQLHAGSNRIYQFAHLRYSAAPKLTRAQRERDAMHKRFYDRYMAAGQKAYRDPRYRLSAVDRRLLLVGELEADVNNGGFSQYLANKGSRRARSALAALRAIGARKTAAMLEQALQPGAALSRLDGRFYKAPEDLALLAARHAKLDLPGRER